MSTAFMLALAMGLDALLGEPRWLWSRLPHPAVVMGRAAGLLDRHLNRGGLRRTKGGAAVLLLVAAAALAGTAIATLPFGGLLSVLLATILLAQRSLADHVDAVAMALRLSVVDGRVAVGHLVGRDTHAMDGPAVSRAAIESAAENFSDAVIAPAFWFLILGLPGLLICKVVNTADSMIGYQNARYREFGWAAARLDDALNWLPARLTAVLIALAHGRPGSWRIIRRDAARHRSPNAGWPEAAMAVSLGVALAGPRIYDSVLHDFAFVHPEGRHEIGAAEVRASTGALWRSWALMLVLLAGGMFA